jgi:murein DD-endopeptidase MepM/ murein hydrolase activator NlpD
MHLFHRRSALLVMLLAGAGAVAAAMLTTGARQPPTLTVSHRARALQPGEVALLTITPSTPLTSVEVRAFGRVEQVRAMPGSPDTWQVLLGLDLDVKPGKHDVSISASSPSGSVSVTYPIDIAAKTFPTRNLKVDPAFVNPPASAAARIARETAETTALWKGGAGPAPAGALTFIAPVPHAANSAFGTRSIFNGEPRNAHSGADFLSPAGTPIKAPARGRVVLAKDLYFSGGSVMVDHGLGIVSLFAHLSAISAKPGEDVEAGRVVGRVGATGRVTGAHLHWTLRVNGARVDPLSMLALLRPR